MSEQPMSEQPKPTRIPQRFMYRHAGGWRFGVCMPAGDGWLIRTGCHFASFDDDPWESMWEVFSDVEEFVWIDNDNGWRDYKPEPTPPISEWVMEEVWVLVKDGACDPIVAATEKKGSPLLLYNSLKAAQAGAREHNRVRKMDCRPVQVRIVQTPEPQPAPLQPPEEIAARWYGVDEVAASIHRRHMPSWIGASQPAPVPVDVYSRQFAEWLTREYRLAMAKGIQLGRGG